MRNKISNFLFTSSIYWMAANFLCGIMFVGDKPMTTLVLYSITLNLVYFFLGLAFFAIFCKEEKEKIVKEKEYDFKIGGQTIPNPKETFYIG